VQFWISVKDNVVLWCGVLMIQIDICENDFKEKEKNADAINFHKKK
jgi:hypothetical protein